MDKRFENLNRQDRSTIIKVLNEKLALAFFSASIAFNVLDNPYVKDFIETLSNTNVSYKPPCRQTLASTILDLLHEKIINEKIKFTTGTDSVLLVDGWLNKSSKKKLLVFTIRNIYADQIFLTYKDFSMQSEDGDNLALHITAAIDYAKEKYDTDVFGIITDNDSKIKCGARNSVNVQDAFLWQATCSSHSANLFLKSFVNPELVLQIIKVVDNFSKPFFDSLLRSANYKGTKIQSYPETRFGYIQLTCQSILNNLKKMREIANDPSIKLDENVFEILHDDDFEKQLRSTLQDIDPVCKLITKCQDPKKNIADATQYWLTLEVPNKYRDLLKERIENAVSPVGLAANILHHKYRGLMLNNTQTIVGQNFIDTKFSAEALEELLSYKQNISDFHNVQNNSANPIHYWSIVQLRYPNLAKFAIRLFLIPASTALIESLFSQWTYVHNVYRNKLGDEKSSHLLDIYHSLRSLNLELYKVDPFEMEIL